MEILIYLLPFLSIGLIVLWFVETRKDADFRLKLSQQNGDSISSTKKIMARTFLSVIFPFSRIILEKFNLNTKLKNRLDAAHVKFTPQEFFNIKIILMALFGTLVFFITGKFDPFLFFVAFALAYIMPDFYLSRKISARKLEIVRILPETVDLLGLCVEAGLDFTSAVKWVIDKVPNNPMIEELIFVLEEIKWGKSRTQALRDMSKRLNAPEISSFVQTLVLAERMGTSVSEAFTILSEDSRLQRFHQGERFAMQAPVKILFTLVFCVLPVIAIIIGGPIFLQFIQNKMFSF